MSKDKKAILKIKDYVGRDTDELIFSIKQIKEYRDIVKREAIQKCQDEIEQRIREIDIIVDEYTNGFGDEDYNKITDELKTKLEDLKKNEN